jgi:hypothetical protein
MSKAPTSQQNPAKAAAVAPRTPMRWVVMAFALLFALALIVIGTSVWMLHLI